MSAPADFARTMATGRTPGFDVARALAVLGMVLVNYDARISADDVDSAQLVWLADRLEGRSAALFVVLAGVGVSLRSRRVRENPSLPVGPERRALLKRAAVLLVAGLLLVHIWPWDILHCYALFLLVAAAVLRARSWVLWSLALVLVAGGVVLQTVFDYDQYVTFWTPLGMLADVGFNGLHPLFPWGAFLLVGMWLGRQDLRNPRTSMKILVPALLAMAVGEALGVTGGRLLDLGYESPVVLAMGSWPRPPTPGYVLAAGGTAIAMVCLCIAVTEPRPAARWVLALTATGQMAFTLYVAHALVVLIPQSHGLLEEGTVAVAWAYGLAFYAAAMALSWWWRRRWPHGPLEGLIRQLAAQRRPAPWGGALISSVLDAPSPAPSMPSSVGDGAPPGPSPGVHDAVAPPAVDPAAAQPSPRGWRRLLRPRRLGGNGLGPLADPSRRGSATPS